MKAIAPDDLSGSTSLVADTPEKHRHEAVAHMVGQLMQDPQFRRKREIVDRSLWRRIAQAVLNFFAPYKLSPEGQKVLDAIKARQKEVQDRESQGPGIPVGDPSIPNDGAFKPTGVSGSEPT